MILRAQATAAVCFLLLASAAQAGTVYAKLLTPTNNGDLWLNINHGSASSSRFNYGYTGYMNWDRISGTEPGVGDPFKSFCIEVTQSVSINGYVDFTAAALENAPVPGPPSPMLMAKADAIRRLWGGFYRDDMSLVEAAAFQLAIWRIEYDLGGVGYDITDFTAGEFRASAYRNNMVGNASYYYGADSTLAITKAGELVTLAIAGQGDYSQANAAHLIALTHLQRQDQVIEVIAPEPTSMGLGALGAILFGAYGYRRRKAALANGIAE